MILEMLATGVVLAVSLLAAGLIWLQGRAQRDAVAFRLVQATIAHAPSQMHHQNLWRRDVEVVHALRMRVEAVLGYRRLRRPHYSATLRTVSLIALAPALAGVGILTQMVGSAALFALPLVWAGCVRLYYGRLEAQLCARLFKQFPDALAMIVRAVRVGVPVTEAVRMVATECQAPTTIEFRQLSDQVALGVPLDQSLRDMGGRNRLAEYRFFATALSLQSQTGGGLTETLETLADTIRKRVAARARGHALASEAKTSCYMLAVLPVIVGAGLYVTNPSYISILFTTSGGHKLLGLAGASLSMGLFCMRTIIRKSLS